MLKSDSPKEEGEISDEDDMVVGVSALVPNMGDSVIILPGPQHARDIPCHAPKVANKTSKQRQKRKSKQRKPVVTYNKETYHAIKVPDTDYCLMIKEYEDARRRSKLQNIDESVLENEIKSSTKVSGNQDIYDSAEDEELLRLRMTALKSAEKRLDSKVDNIQYPDTFSSQDSNVDNYDVVHMEMDSDADDNNNLETDSQNIDFLQEHIQHLKQQKQELIESQKRIEHQQNMLSEVTPDHGISIPPLMTQGPLFSIIQHNLHSSTTVRPLLSLSCSLPAPTPSAVVRAPLLPEPKLRGPLLPKPALLPIPKQPLLMPEHSLQRLSIRQPLLAPKPLMSLSFGNVHSGYSNNPRPTALQSVAHWSSHACYSPRPIEVIGAGCRNVPLLPSPPFNSDLKSVSYSTTTNITSSTGSSTIGMSNKASPRFQMNEDASKDPLYEDFEDEMQVIRDDLKSCSTSLININETPTPASSPSPSWLLSLPQYEGLTTNNKDFEERNNSDFESAEIVQKVEVKDDDESYLNHLKNKLLLDIELRKTMTHKVMSENVMKNSNKSINQNHSLPDCNPTRSQKKLDEEEEDFFDMIVIDSDHESSSPTKNFDHSYQETFYNEDVKPDISSQLVQQCLVIAPSFDEEPSERLDGECLTPSDESKDEEMILRARLLKSFAARKIKQEQLKQETMNSQPKDEKKELVLQSFYQQRFGEDFDESKNHQKLLINIKSEVPVPSVKRSLKRKKRRNRKRKNNVTGHAALPTTKQKISFRPQTFSKRRNASIPNATKFVPPPQTHSSSTSTAIPAATHGQTSQSQIDRTVFNILPKQPASTSAVNVKLPASVMKFAVSTSDTKLQEPSAEPRVKVETKKESSNSAGVAVSSRPSTAVSSAFQNRPFKASGDDVRTSNVKIQSSRTKVEGHRGSSRQPVRAPARRTDSRLVQTISNKYSKFPNCEPIVIYLNGDESEESDKEEDGSENTETGDMDICNRLESLLKEARKEVTPACSGRSPEDDLVTSVARETKTETRPLSSLENNKTTTNSDITTTITNSGIALKKTVVQHALKKDKLENLNKEELMKREKELEVSLLTHKLKQLEDKSSKESKSLKEEKVRLLKLESVLSKRRAELVTTEANAQKIREQLEAVLKILNHNQLQVAELDKKREALRSHILEKERKTLRTSNDITECQEKLLTVTKSIKLNIQEHHNKQTTSLMQQTNSNATKSKQQSRHKRKLSTATNDPDLPPAKRWAVVSTLPVTLDSVTTGGTSASTSTVAKTLERTSGEVTTRTKSSSGESRVSTEISKSILKSKNSASLQQKSSSRKVKLPPQNTKDEKFLKIKDAHRKSTLRNHQPMQTTTTQLRLSVFSQAQKLLNFNVGLVQRGDSSPKLNSLKRKSFDEAEENVSSRMSGLLRSIKSFRTENEFSSSTFTNKLDNNVPLCQFELLGKCNDDNCPWQHERDYSMTTKEVLMEIASYHPSVVPSIDAKTPPSKYKALVGAYVDDFMTRSKQTDAKKLYLMMLHLVSQAKGSAIFTPLDQDRLWSVRQDKNPGKVKDSRVLNEDQEEQNANSNMLAPDLGPQLDEDGSSTLDCRYWTTSRASSREAADKNRNASHDDGGSDGDADGSTAQDHKRVASLHEEAFLKKAMSIIGEETKSKFPSKLDTALKVLAKGIEHHPHSQNLWQHYLRMFVQKRNREAKRGSPTIISNPPQMDSTGPKSEHDSTNNCNNNNNNNNNDDVSDQLRVAFVNALEMVPSYDLHWQFIRVSESFSDKMEACNLALHYLCSDQVNSLEEDAISHWLLEVILHQAQICFHTGKNTMGMDLIEDCLNAQDVYGLLSRMTTSDRVILWMSFLHLSIFHFAPSCLFSRTNDNAGMIVSKTPFTIINHHLSLSAKQLTNNDNDCSEMVSWYDKAIAECLTYFFESPPKDLAATGEEDGRSFAVGPTVTPQSDWEAWAWLSRVIISKANLLVEFKRYEDAISFLSSMSKLMPEVHDIRISLLHVTGDIASCTDDKSIRGHEIFASNVEYAHGCFSAKLTYHVAKLLVSKDQSEEALQLLERLPIRIHDSNSGKEDPNILYCKLLDLELPAGFIPPSYSKGFTKESIENERVHFWLCYCLLLDLQGDYDSMEDAYSRAVCRQRNAADLGEIWLARLDRLVCSSGSLATDEIQSEFFGLVEKSLSSMPVRLLLPLSEIGGKTYDSYDVHNNIIAFCVQRMASLESLTSFYDWTLSMMPGNSQLAVEAINHFTRNKCRSLTKGFILICLQEAPRCLALWKTSLKLAMLEGNTDQMRTEYKKALEYLPYQKKLWKDFMLFEMVNRREEAVDRIVGRCQQLGVNIVDLYKSLSAR